MNTLVSKKTSGPGHVFYGISNDGGKTVTAYGFAPPDGSEKFDWYSPDKPGKVQPNEHKVYREQVYRKTVAITEAQYKVLEDFGKTQKNTVLIQISTTGTAEAASISSMPH